MAWCLACVFLNGCFKRISEVLDLLENGLAKTDVIRNYWKRSETVAVESPEIVLSNTKFENISIRVFKFPMRQVVFKSETPVDGCL